MADEPHKHEWEDAWGADCVVCHVDLIGYAESAQERITTLETQYAAAMAIVRAVATKGVTMYDSDGTSEARMTPEIVDAARALLAQE